MPLGEGLARILDAGQVRLIDTTHYAHSDASRVVSVRLGTEATIWTHHVTGRR